MGTDNSSGRDSTQDQVPASPALETEFTSTPDAGLGPPKRVGHYTLTREIGGGGMGVVYLAQQDKPARVVAVKLMRSGMISSAALRRFEFESQLLARLRHPAVAQVFEAGTHHWDGRDVPFYAMEYIPDAKAITE